MKADAAEQPSRARPPFRNSKAMTPHTQSILLHCSLHLVSGRSTPSVSSSETWCRKPSCGETETTMRPSTSRIGWRSCRFQSRRVSRWPLNAAMEKSGPLRKADTAFGVAGLGARRGFADHARGRPGLHVERGHAPRVQLDEAVLDLDRAPLVLRGVPTGRHQARRAGDRPRIPGAIGQVDANTSLSSAATRTS